MFVYTDSRVTFGTFGFKRLLVDRPSSLDAFVLSSWSFQSYFQNRQCPVQFVTVLYQAQQPNSGQGRLILEVSRSHTMTHYSQQDSSARTIGPSQRPLPENTTFTRDRHPCPRQDFFCILLYFLTPTILLSLS